VAATWASADQLTVYLELIGGNIKLTHRVSDLPTGKVLVTQAPDTGSLPFYLRSHSLPVIRGKGLVKWADGMNVYPTLLPFGVVARIKTYEHDCGWFVQGDNLAILADYLVGQLSQPEPTVTSVEIDPDPRIERGDKVTLQDPARTGLEIDLMITKIDQSWTGNSPSMTLSGTLTDVRQVSTPTNPVSQWGVLIQNWRG